MLLYQSRLQALRRQPVGEHFESVKKLLSHPSQFYTMSNITGLIPLPIPLPSATLKS
jgi:hypothetical protein